MKAYGTVIVKTDKIYNTKKGNIILTVTRDEMKYVNKEVEVVSAPSYTNLKEGDKIMIHHNILREKINTNGEIINSDYFIKKGYYRCPLTEVYLCKSKGSSTWESFDPFVFIKPIEFEQEESKLLIHKESLKSNSNYYKGHFKERGTIRFINQELTAMGLKEGDKIVFSKNSEFEFIVDGELLYRMRTKDILAKIE